MSSRLLQQLVRLLLPLALVMGAALLLKGHDEPGGGFVAGLSLAMAGVLALVSHGPRCMRLGWPVERWALVGVAISLTSLAAPLALGWPLLTHASGTLPLVGKWHASLVFDIGLALAIGAALVAAAQALWRVPAAPRSEGD